MMMKSKLMERIQKLRKNFIKKTLNLKLYPSQTQVCDAIIQSSLWNDGDTILSCFPRQYGKTTALTAAVGFLNVFYFDLVDKFDLQHRNEFNTVFFAPQYEQSKTDFDRLKGILRPYQRDFGIDFDEANGNTIRIGNGCTNYCFTLAPTSSPESKTADLIIFEEAQDLEDERINKVATPMGASTNATKVYNGTAGYQKCLFQNYLERNEKHKFIYDCWTAIKEKQEAYELDGNPFHLNYKKHIINEIRRLGGEDNDEFKTQYLNLWVLERGQFITYDQLLTLEGTHEIINEEKEKKCYAGVDWGKASDSTVVTIIDEDFRILKWFEMQGDDYDSQFHRITKLLQNYNIQKMMCDATGSQDMMVDRFKTKSKFTVEGWNFSQQSKDDMWRNLSRFMYKWNINQTGLPLSFPKGSSREKDKFITQLTDLTKEIKNNRWVCEHPEGRGYHDDYCFVAGTNVMTDKGNVSIECIKIGDKILTRKGFKKVLAIGNREEEVISRFGLTGTPDHPFITSKGIKPFYKLNVSDSLYIWNEKQLSIKEKSIIDILNQNTGNYEFITGPIQKTKNHLKHFIDKFGKTITEQYLKALLFITKTKIHLTILLKILMLCQEENISQCMQAPLNELKNQEKRLKSMQDQKQFFGINQKKEENGIKFITNKVLKKLNYMVMFAKNVILNMKVQGLQGLNSVQKDVNKETGGNVKRVYNLKIEDANEYFANNILVHNCDSLGLAVLGATSYVPGYGFAGKFKVLDDFERRML